MKRNAITRIIIYSIIIVILLGILLTGLGVGMFMVDFSAEDSQYTVLQAPTVLFAPEEVKNLQIEWASGNIDITTGDVNAITITETGSFSEKEAMAYKQSGDTVYIRDQKEPIKFGFFSLGSSATSKDLTVTIPKGWTCGEMTIEVASADVRIDSLSAEKVDIDTASGDHQFLSCEIDELNVNTASGSIEFEGYLNTLDCDAASGRFTGVFFNTPHTIEMDSASGDLDITLPADTGFAVNMEALSGHFNSDFPTSKNDNSYVYGNGECQIEFDGASGNIQIRKGA